MAACPTCGQENPAGARFCNACGAPLESGSEVRKTVTVLFADVTGSATLGEQLDPESFRRVMALYFGVARAAVERHGGAVEKFIGDAVMAAFGVPTVHEDDALRGLRAAVDVRSGVEALNSDLQAEYGVSLAVRIGVNTGEVVAGTAERLVTGDPVNVAARLQQAADPGEILAGEPTVELARDAIDTVPLAPLELKGKSELLAAYRVVGVAAGGEAFVRRLDAPLVGRREELDAVRAAFDGAVAERRCRLVTVLGPPGIGKSRLAREAAALLAAHAGVLQGRCLPYGDGITYWPLREMFAAAGGEDELAAALASDNADEIAWAVRKAFERRADERPLALVVEDIHWAEPTLLDLLEHLVEWTRDAPLLLVCLARPELLAARPAWPGASITLEPLSDDESEQLIGELLGGADLDEAGRIRIRDVAEGNPLFVEQLLANVAEGDGGVPATIQALLGARLDALPDEERFVIERAAVIGVEFEWEALAHLAPDGRRPAGAVLSSLVRKELMRPHDAIPDTFAFRHILIRDAAYDRLPKRSRAQLHERAAGWIGERGQEFDEIVGYHLEQAYRSLADLGPTDAHGRELAERAAERLGASGRRALARGDAPAAINLLERAAALAGGRPTLNIALGRALVDAGEWQRADEVFSAAAVAAEDTSTAAHAAVELTWLRLHTDTSVTHARVYAELEEPVRIFEEQRDGAGLARALTLTGLLLFYGGQAAAGIEELLRAARYARDAGDRVQEAQSLGFAVNASVHGPTPVGEALALVAEARARMRGSRQFEANALASQVAIEAMRGDFDAARRCVAEATMLARDLGQTQTLAVRIGWAHGYALQLAGDLAGAERALREACEELERMGDVGHLTSSAPELAQVLCDRGRPEEAWPWLEKAAAAVIEEDADAQAWIRMARARLVLRRGEAEEAELLAREAVELAGRMDYLNRSGRALATLAEILAAQGRAAEAAAALDEAVGFYERKGNVAAIRPLRGSVGESV
jgi:class 3 adenylate cyclase/tetratricopeptide (TPR) repeat protein